MPSLEDSIENLPRLQPQRIKALKRLGIFTARDLLFHFPFRYDDFSKISNISQISVNQNTTVEGKIIKSKTTRTWKRKMFVTEVEIQDESGKIRAVWFNQPYLAEQLAEGKKIRVSGIVRGSASLGRLGREKLNLFADKEDNLYFNNPAWELASRTPTNTARLVPIYPETEGITSRWLRWQIQLALKKYLFNLKDFIPWPILKKLHLPILEKAIQWIHFPNTLNHALVAQKRFAFEEMFLLQLKSLQIRSAWQKEQAVRIKFNEKIIKHFVARLPFRLTNAQRKASFEILKDLEKARPMNRLLNGDVGSGKTVVAAMASLEVVRAGYQAALMAPTEILAKQHFKTLCKLFAGYEIKIGLLTNAYRLICHPELAEGSNNKLDSSISLRFARNDILNKIKSGQINLVIGTHALIQDDIKFKNLALVIVDEQHRFGVSQRAYLQSKASTINDGLPEKIPHFLTMTATPIPRTLALAFFGNLDVSLLDEMPTERKKIITQIVGPLERKNTYDFIRGEIKKGRQCFIILPLVEESKVLTEVKAAVAEHKRLSEEVFPDLKLGLVHGRLKPAEKEKVMRDFAENKTKILVATPVVEVGIDIPNATAMIIEDADRFGLSQLHQFRGRIGRGEHQSFCFLFASGDSSSAKKRLKVIAENTDGFKIAEYDLKLRGPGEFLGTRQSGPPDIAMENIANVKLVQIAREEAERLLKTDPQLKNHPPLKSALNKFNRQVHLE